jgi:hypothetical protein
MYYPPHKELRPYYSVIPPHTGLCPLLQCYPTWIVMSHTAVINLHIKSYSPYCNIILPHTEL